MVCFGGEFWASKIVLVYADNPRSNVRRFFCLLDVALLNLSVIELDRGLENLTGGASSGLPTHTQVVTNLGLLLLNGTTISLYVTLLLYAAICSAEFNLAGLVFHGRDPLNRDPWK